MRGLTIAFFGLASLAACSRGDTDNTAQPAVSPETSGQTAAPVAYASLTGDAAKGETLFMQCRACHSLEPDKTLLGPSLHGVIGRPAAHVAGFAYSPAMKASGLTWTEDMLYRYIGSPRDVVPGTKMAYAGMTDAQSRADLIAYLKSASK